MQDTANFSDALTQTAENIIEILKASGGNATSWDMKLKLHLSSSTLYLALGWLAAKGRIALYPKELNFKIVLTEEKQDKA